MKKYIDLSLRFVPENESAKVLKELGFSIVAVDQGGSYIKGEELVVVPRATFVKPKEVSAIKGNVVRVYRVENPRDLKITNQVKSRAHALELGGSCLGRLGIKNLRKLSNANIPIIVNSVELFGRLLEGKPVAGFIDVLRLYIKGRISLVVGSGARSLREVKHPMTVVGLLVELGLDEGSALSTLTTNPRYVVRRAGYVA